MRQPLVPRAGDAHLLRAVFRRKISQRMDVAARRQRPCAARIKTRRITIFQATFDPELIDSRRPPIQKQADAVAAAEDRVEMILHHFQRQVFKDILPHLKCRRKIQGELCNDAKCASPTTAPQNFSPSFSREISITSPLEVTIRIAATAAPRIALRSPDPCVAVAHAPATEICGSDARLCNANPAMKLATKLAVADAGLDGDGRIFRLRIDRHNAIHLLQRDLIARCVGDFVERMPRAQRFHLAQPGGKRADFRQRGRLVHVRGNIFVMARPVVHRGVIKP